MQILHYLSRVDERLGGVVCAAKELALATAETGARVRLVSTELRDVPHEWRQQGGADKLVWATELSARLGAGGRLDARSTDQLLTLAKPADMVHLHGAWDIGSHQFASKLRRSGIPYIVSVHGMLDDWSLAQKRFKKRLALALFAKRFFSHAAGIHCSAEREFEQVQSNLQLGEQVFFEPFPLPADFATLPGAQLAKTIYRQVDFTKPIVLFLGRLVETKGAGQLAKAAAMIAKDHSFQIVFAGEGPEEYLEQLRSQVDQLGLGSRSHFLGMVQGKEKMSLYQAADMFVLPTEHENFGIVLAEAMAAKCPVITTRGAAIWSELENAGAFIVSSDPQAIAEAMARLFDDPAKRIQLGEQGAAFVHRWLDRKRIGERFLEHYRRCADSNDGETRPAIATVEAR